MWADGNWYLIFNTWVSLFQGICSFLLTAEFPTYLGTRDFQSRTLREFSYGLAMIYDTIFFYFLCELLFSIWSADENYSGFSLITDLFIAYNVMMNFPIFIINGVIIWKEIRFEYGYGHGSFGRINWAAN